MTPVPSTWLEHHRAADREPVGWLREDGDGWVAVDLLGRDVTGAVTLDRAEAALDEFGIGYLADKWEFEHGDGSVEPVRLVEVAPEHIRTKTEDYGAIDAPVVAREVPWPAPKTLQPRR